MRGSVVQYQLLSAKQGSRNLVVMNIHRAKGKEFDEVFVYEELHTPFVRQGETDLSATHARSSGGNVGGVIAVGFVVSAASMRIRIPADLSGVGYDDIPAARHLSPR